jgi:hypothetical protein
MAFEYHTKPLLSCREFLRPQARHAGSSLILLAVSIELGTAGCPVFGGLAWIDPFLNASITS